MDLKCRNAILVDKVSFLPARFFAIYHLAAIYWETIELQIFRALRIKWFNPKCLFQFSSITCSTKECKFNNKSKRFVSGCFQIGDFQSRRTPWSWPGLPSDIYLCGKKLLEGRIRVYSWKLHLFVDKISTFVTVCIYIKYVSGFK